MLSASTCTEKCAVLYIMCRLPLTFARLCYPYMSRSPDAVLSALPFMLSIGSGSSTAASAGSAAAPSILSCYLPALQSLSESPRFTPLLVRQHLPARLLSEVVLREFDDGIEKQLEALQLHAEQMDDVAAGADVEEAHTELLQQLRSSLLAIGSTCGIVVQLLDAAGSTLPSECATRICADSGRIIAALGVCAPYAEHRLEKDSEDEQLVEAREHIKAAAAIVKKRFTSK
jgi:hypothetical protein